MKDMVLKARENEETMLELIKRFEPLMKKNIRRYVKDFALHEDALQEARYIFIKCVYKYDVSLNIQFEGYIKNAMNYSLRDYAAHINNHQSIDEEITEDGGTLHDLLRSDEDIEGDKIFRELRSELTAALNSLPESQRNVIIAFYIKKTRITEICQNRRCHYMNIVKLKERGLKNLKDYLTKKGYGI